MIVSSDTVCLHNIQSSFVLQCFYAPVSARFYIIDDPMFYISLSPFLLFDIKIEIEVQTVVG